MQVDGKQSIRGPGLDDQLREPGEQERSRPLSWPGQEEQETRNSPSHSWSSLCLRDKTLSFLLFCLVCVEFSDVFWQNGQCDLTPYHVSCRNFKHVLMFHLWVTVLNAQEKQNRELSLLLKLFEHVSCCLTATSLESMEEQVDFNPTIHLSQPLSPCIT